MKKIILLSFILALAGLQSWGQTITGTVYATDEKNHKQPLPGVNIYWVATQQGTSSNVKGHYSISSKGIKDQRLIFSFLGYSNDTIVIDADSRIDVVLSEENKKLGEVVINGNTGGAYVSRLNARNVQVINKGEIFRAACCNLAESFETNASVDVLYSDAITGAKQIQLLGLSGVYSQIVTENVPLVRGLASSFGLNYVPGSWMESILVSKGTSSVVNGFESVTGQINVEYKKPAESEKLFVNLYGNDKMRLEANMNSRYIINDHLSTMLFVHASQFQNPFDKNGDNFMDIPKTKTINLFNRWDYRITNRGDSRFGIKYMQEERDGGFMNYNKDSFTEDTVGIQTKTKPYGIGLKTKRWEAFWKNGIIFPDNPNKSLALIISGIKHDQEGLFGLNEYTGKEQSFYANLLYATTIGNPNHKITGGASLQLNDYDETYFRKDFKWATGKIVSILDTNFNNKRQEQIPGVFVEYTYKYTDVFSLILGGRVDHHNEYGTFFTPRMHFRYQFSEHWTVKGSAGKGYRTVNIFAENYSLMASQRTLYFPELQKDPKAWNFGLNQEEAWNYGLNLAYDFTAFHNKAQLDFDFYRTDFVQQVVVDMDSVVNTSIVPAYFYNLKGQSFSNVGQIQLTVEPVKHFTVLTAFRINDVWMTTEGKLQRKSFVNAYKALITLAYATKFDKWKFDLTGQFNGKGRLPNTSKMPVSLQREEYSPEFFNLLAQVTKKYKNWDFYLGGENLTGFTQKDPITLASNPFHPHFDTSMVWGPLVGASVYAGLRYTVK